MITDKGLVVASGFVSAGVSGIFVPAVGILLAFATMIVGVVAFTDF